MLIPWIQIERDTKASLGAESVVVYNVVPAVGPMRLATSVLAAMRCAAMRSCVAQLVYIVHYPKRRALANFRQRIIRGYEYVVT